MLDFKKLFSKIEYFNKEKITSNDLANTPENIAMRTFLDSPTPELTENLDNCKYLAVDIETTGLSSNKDTILSIGFVPINRRCIDLSQAQHFYVKTQVSVGESATIHNIKDSDIQTKGQAIEDVMTSLLKALSGRVLLVHYANLDYSFLNIACKKLYGIPLQCQVIDTLQVEKRRLLRENPNHAPTLRLDDCRQNYNLPRYSAHNALTDALATAELWVAQMAVLQENSPIQLKEYC